MLSQLDPFRLALQLRGSPVKKRLKPVFYLHFQRNVPYFLEPTIPISQEFQKKKEVERNSYLKGKTAVYLDNNNNNTHFITKI